jgi:hypothetical protein
LFQRWLIYRISSYFNEYERKKLKLWHFISDIHETSDEGRESVPKRLKTEHGMSQVRVRKLTLESI